MNCSRFSTAKSLSVPGRYSDVLLLSLLFVFGLMGCEKPAKSPWQVSEEFLWPEHTGDYRDITLKWSRQDIIYDGVETLLQAYATIHSLEWREAYARKYSEVYLLTNEEYERFLQDQMRAHENSLDFIVALSSTNPDHSKIRYNDPLWQIFILHNGQKTYPIEVRSLRWPQQKLKEFFPYFKPWQFFYVIKFPKPENETINLTIAGPGGLIDLNWEASL